MKTNTPRLAVIGFGAMARALEKRLREGASPIPVSAALVQAVHCDIPADIAILHAADELMRWRPDLVVECAGHSAVRDHVPALLAAGVPVAIASIGALADQNLRNQLSEAADRGGGRLIVPSGAVGGLDVLRAAGPNGLASVLYVGRKPPLAWTGTPAEATLDLSSVTAATLIFEGTAAEASRLFPKNANVTAAIALAGVGFEQTNVRLFADPTITQNQHEIEAEGSFGRFSIRLSNQPLPENPKTSLLAALSLEDAVRRHIRHPLL